MRAATALALALLALVSRPAFAKELEIKVTGGEGQLRRILAPRSSVEAVLVLRFGAGYADEASVRGGTVLAVHALLSMHKRVKYGDLLETLHGATPHLTTSIGPHQTTFTLRAHRDEMMGAAEQLVTALLSPAFEAPAYAGAVERAMVDGVPRSPLDELVGRLSMFTFVSDIRYRPDLEAERLEATSWPTTKRFVETMFSPANATAIATGGFNPAAMEALLARRGGERNSPRMPKLPLPMSHRFHAREESHLFYFPLDLGDGEKVAAARVLVALLSERVGQRMRRLPSSFPVEVRALAQAPFAGVAVSLPDHPSAGTDLSAHVRQEVQAIHEGRTTPEQFTAAREDAVRRFQQVDARPELLAEEILAGLDAPADWLGADALAAVQHLEAKKMVELVGPQLVPEKTVHLFFSPEVAPSEATALTDGEAPK